MQLLPVAIMAHNEEKVIRGAIESVLRQKIPAGFTVKIVICVNGCSDRTEDVVKEIAEEIPDRIDLLSIREKGKTKAINETIKYLDNTLLPHYEIPYVIFLDADCNFLGNDNLINFVEQFDWNIDLCAVGADCLPDVAFNYRKDMIAHLYRAIHGFSRAIRINTISGMCYGIRLSILRIIHFPDFQFAEDMFIAARVNGRFLKKDNVRIVYKTPKYFTDEIKRRTRQAVSTQRYHDYYSYLRKKGDSVKLFKDSLGSGFKWGKAEDCNIIRAWIGLKGIRSKILVLGYFLIRIFAKVRARIILKKLRANSDLDYWKVAR